MESWNHVWQDPVAGLRALPPCMCLGDLKKDGDCNLIIADLKKKLRVYRGNAICWESVLFDVPSAITVFHSDAGSLPSLAVAIGNYIYIYKNSRPYYKFCLPAVNLSPQEIQIWELLQNAQRTPNEAWNALNELRDNDIYLSSRSQDLLSFDKEEEKERFVDSVKQIPLVQHTTINCLAVLKRESDHELSPSMLCVGTEHQMLYLLDQLGTSVEFETQIPGIPAFMACTGQYLREYRVIVATRDHKLYTFRNGNLTSTVIELETAPVGLVLIDRYLIVGSTDKKVHCYHSRGKKLYSLYMPDTILSLVMMNLTRDKVFTGILVALNNGEIRMYKDKSLITVLEVGETVNGLCFGVFGSQDGCLVLNTLSGGIVVKRLDPKLKLEKKIEFAGPPKEQDVPLNVPSISKLYVEQVEREKEGTSQMYFGYMRDLLSMKLNVAKTYMEALKIETTHSNSQTAPVKLDAYIQGLGPLFTVYFEVQNVGRDPYEMVFLSFNYSVGSIKLLKNNESFPVLLPGMKYKAEIPLENTKGTEETIRLFLTDGSSQIPLISALVTIPACEIYE